MKNENSCSVTDESGNEGLDCLMEDVNESHEINRIHCGVRTLELAIRGASRSGTVSNPLTKSRQVVAAVRMPKIDRIIRRRDGKSKILDQTTTKFILVGMAIHKLI